MTQRYRYSLGILYVLLTTTKQTPLFSPNFLQSALAKPHYSFNVQFQEKPASPRISHTFGYTQEELEALVHKLLICYVLYSIVRNHYAFLHTEQKSGITYWLYNAIPTPIQHAHYYAYMITQTAILTGITYCYKIIARWLLWCTYRTTHHHIPQQKQDRLIAIKAWQ